MIISMTGYASHERNTNNGVLQVELRSVNQRYLELQLKLEDTLRAQEPQVRELLKQKLGRGKVECRINLAQVNTAEAIELNHSVLQNIAASVKAASDYFPATQAVNVLDVLLIPGVMVAPVFDAEALTQDVMTALDVALETLIAARGREGEKLKSMILARLAEIESLIFTVKPMLPTMVKAHQDKLLAKLQEAQLSHDEERIRQEIVLYTQRIDVDEELSRMMHVRAF